MKNKSVKISAVICTHSHTNYLYKAIKSLINQNLPKELYEIMIVDNNPLSNTKKLIKDFSRVKNLKYVHEPILGISQARNTGWKMQKENILHI